MSLDSTEKLQLLIFSGLILAELFGDTTLAQVPVIGDLGNAGLDGLLNTAEFLITLNMAGKN